MPRNGKAPVTRLQKCAAAIERLNEAERLLKEIKLNTVPHAMRPALKTARTNLTATRGNVVSAMKADTPALPTPLQRVS